MKNITYISASAGSGKTYELTERLKKAILGGECKPEEVILTTFTKAAASEFKAKAKAKFYEVGKTEAANRLDQALIGTVDSVANVFVNRYWYLLGISPKLNVIKEEDEKVFIAESLSNLPTKEQNDFFHNFAELFKIPEIHEGGIKYGIDYGFWKEDLKKIFNASRSYAIKDFSDSITASKRLIESVSLSCSKLDFNRDELLSRLDELDAISNADKTTAARDTRIAETDRFRKVVKNKESTQLDIGIALSEMITKGKFSTKGYQNSTAYQELELASNKIWTCEEVRELQFTYITHLFDIANRWQDKYLKYKKEQHIIDYTDMEEYLWKLITKDEYKTAQDDISKTYKYLFVDEFQDCSPTQIKIFDRLSDLVEQTIWVGDYKQAIYGFRGSDTALVKAVTDRIEKLNKKPNETLGTSHRSWPPVVDVCNGIFVPAFSDILREEEVRLNVWDKLETVYKSNKRECLKAWLIDEIDHGKKSNKKIASQVASNIARMIKDEKFLPEDIAVLARSNKELTEVALALKEYNIPALVGDTEFQQSSEITLLNSMLSLVVNPADTYARASIAYLTEEKYTAAAILDTRFESLSNNKKDWEYLEEIPLIQKLMTKRDEYKSQSIAGLVENLIIEMDLYNVAKRCPDSDNSENTLHTAIEIAHTYEDHCIQMSLPCTIYGFIDYILTVKAKSAGSSNGVQLFTYHGSKGLEWKNVILLSLGDDILDENDMIGYNIYGVHTYHEVTPNADNPYPTMLITVLPWIFGSKTTVPKTVKDMIIANQRYKEIVKTFVQEEKRLMYVAMTRPVESLILTVNQNNGLLRLKQMGINVTDNLPQSSSSDLLGIGKLFVVENVADMDGWKFKTPEKKTISLYGQKQDYKKRDQQPSSSKTDRKVTAKIVLDTGKRISLNTASDKMDKLGTCIHDIFCVIENNKDESFIKHMIQNHAMENVLQDASEIKIAWNNLENFLVEKYGKKINSYHELPFKQQYEGQIFTGSIDLVWEGENGVVLIDYKSYPGNKDDVVNPKHAHFAGMYSGQFACYERALNAAGKRVIGRIIYYHVLGVGVELEIQE